MSLSKFSSPHDGRPAVKLSPSGPHDHRRGGITQALNGQDVIAVDSVTGSGKSAYIYMLALNGQTIHCYHPPKKVSFRYSPSHTGCGVCPTTALEDHGVRR